MLLLDFSLVALSRLQKLLCLESHSICYFLRTGSFEGQALDSIFEHFALFDRILEGDSRHQHVVTVDILHLVHGDQRLLVVVHRVRSRMAVTFSVYICKVSSYFGLRHIKQFAVEWGAGLLT